MAENLKVTHYRNGESIIYVTGLGSLQLGTYRNYGNNPTNTIIYGCLYNWYAVDDARNIAPEGWHVPTDEEWQILIDYVGGSSIAGGKLKEEGTAHWKDPNLGATNENDFTGLPGGACDRNGDYWYIKEYGYWWTSTKYVEGNLTPSYAWKITFSYLTKNSKNRYSPFSYSFSVRCIKD